MAKHAFPLNTNLTTLHTKNVAITAFVFGRVDAARIDDARQIAESVLADVEQIAADNKGELSYMLDFAMRRAGIDCTIAEASALIA